ncbi:MAG TPA: adenylate/guanylate cyclase domain-containing protein [Blastocatellia bacterium]|nr:adenylate/guanylate cyclase domain-containing protein [Blastocatellia bacterium]
MVATKLKIKNSNTGDEYDYDLSAGQTRLGRAPEYNDIVLKDEKVSRRHAVIKQNSNDDGYTLVDLGSINGSYVNGEPVTEHTLTNGDEISIGAYTLVYTKVADSKILYDNRLGGTLLLRSAAEAVSDLTRIDPELVASLSGPQATVGDLQALYKKAQTLSHIYELNRLLSSVFSLEDIFADVKDMIFRLTPADRFFVLLKESGGEELNVFMSKFRNKDLGGAISRTVLNKVVSERVALLSSDTQADQRLAEAKSLFIQNVHSVMCAPLIAASGIIGVIYVDCQDAFKTFSSDDLDLLNAVASSTSMAVVNATTHDQLVREALARAAYGRFMPKHIVDEILVNPEAVSLGGVNKVVTILFSDIRGFTSMAEGLPPDKVVQILNEYFACMTPLVFDNHGLLDKYIGDGLMALFGVPHDDGAAAADAVRAAIAMQKKVVELNQSFTSRGMPEIHIGIGINTGNVTVGYIGSEQRTDYTAVGDSVNLAARLEEQALSDQIIASQSTIEGISDGISTKACCELRVKGKKEPVHVYEVIWD